jgi:hypothetical protein
LKTIGKAVLPVGVRRKLRSWLHPTRRSALDRFPGLSPVSRVFGLDRGRPIDRYYIERFLEGSAADVAGRVLEVGDADYTRRFGRGRVTQSDVLHAEPGNRRATIVGDLTTGRGVPHGAFSCVILTQVLPFVYDVPAAVRTCHAALAPGGVLLATVPGISQVSRYDADRWGDFWRFTPQSVARMFADTFGDGAADVRTHGNVLVACAFLQGLASHELTPAELDAVDPDYPVLMTVRAVKGGYEWPAEH